MTMDLFPAQADPTLNIILCATWPGEDYDFAIIVKDTGIHIRAFYKAGAKPVIDLESSYPLGEEPKTYVRYENNWYDRDKLERLLEVHEQNRGSQ